MLSWDEAISRIDEYAGRPDDELDADGLMPPTMAAVAAARREAGVSRDRGDEPPLRVVPDGEGGIQFEWRRPGRIAVVKARIAGKLKAPSRKARHEDYKKRLAEFEARLEEIQNAWRDAPDLERAAAHAAIDKLDAVGVPLGGV